MMVIKWGGFTRSSLWTWCWQVQLLLRRLGRGRLLWLLLLMLAAGWHGWVAQPQLQQVQTALQPQRFAIKGRTVTKGSMQGKPVLPPESYGARSTQMLHILQQYGFQPQRLSFSSVQGGGALNYRMDCVLTGEYPALYLVLAALQEKAAAQVTRLSIERASQNDAMLQARISLVFGVTK
jgi:hypothetical protein